MAQAESEISLDTKARWQVSPHEFGPRTSSFYCKAGKRVLDIIASSLGLVLLGPVFLLIAILVKTGSPGPVLFWQMRVGLCGRQFAILKFRTMVVRAGCLGPGITVSGDPRVTRVGSLLRRFKLDELPQLWNVLIGDMSLVGPRPELPEYVADYTTRQRRVLSVRPGITDYASLVYRHEEEVLSTCIDPEQLYREVVLPHKLALNLEYISRMSLAEDLRLILATLISVFASPPRRS